MAVPRGVGSIYMTLLLKEGLFNQAVKKAARDAGNDSGEAYFDAFEKRAEREQFNKLYDTWYKKNRPLSAKLGDSLGSVMAFAWGDGLTRRGRLIYRAILTFADPIAAAGTAIIAPLIALAGSLGLAITGPLTGLVPLLGVVVGGFAAVALGAQNFGGALKAMNAELATAAIEGRDFNINAESIQAALGVLTPNARAFATAIGTEVLPGLREMRLTLQDALFAGLADEIGFFAERTIPKMTTGLGFMASALNNVGLTAIRSLGGLPWDEFFLPLAGILQTSGEGLIAFFRGLFDLTIALAPAAQQLADWFKNLGLEFQAWIGQDDNQAKMMDFFLDGVSLLREWWEVIKPLGQAIGNVFSTGMPFAIQLLDYFQQLAEEFLAFTNTPEGIAAMQDFFSNGVAALQAFLPVLKGVSGFFTVLVTPELIARTGDLVQSLNLFLPVLGKVFSILGKTGILETFGRLLADIAGVLVSSGILDILSEIAGIIATTLSTALSIVSPLLQTLGDAFSAVLGAIAPVLPVLAEAFISAFAPLIPVIVEVVNTLVSVLMPVIQPLIKLFAAFAPIIVQLVIAFNPWLRLLFLLLPVISMMEGPLTALSEGLGKFIDWLAVGVEKIAPFISKMIAFVAGFLGFGKIGASVARRLGEFGTKIQEFALKVGTFFENATKPAQGLLGIFRTVFSAIGNVIRAWFNIFVDAWAGIRLALEAVGNFLKSVFGPLISTVFNAYKTVILGAFDFVRGVITAAIGAFRGIGDAIFGFAGRAQAALEAFTVKVIEIFTTLGSIVRTIFNLIWTVIKGVFISIYRTVQPIVQGMATFISNVISGLRNTWSLIWNGMKNVIVGVWTAVRNTVTGILNGVRNTWTGVWNSIKNTVSNVWNGIRGAVTSGINGVRNTVTNVLNSIRNTWTSIWNGIKNFMSGIWGGIKSAASSALGGLRGIVNGALSPFRAAINAVNKIPGVNIPNIPQLAAGSVLTAPTLAVVGEAGREAVVPLDRPYSQIDPSVRDMARLIRGDAGATVVAGGSSRAVTMNVYPQASDPEAVAASLLNRLALGAA